MLNVGPAGKLLKLMDRHPFRPAHIHIIVSLFCYSMLLLSSVRVKLICVQATHDGYKPLTTQIFDSKDQYLTNDSVFAVKDSLIVDFVPREGDPQAGLELNYDVKLVPAPSNSTNDV